MLIVATAGHIDHGKTSLVRALTGIETDSLPEERARGISIDLGFAYWEAAPDALVAFVDVPGHHRFIRNMIAGVAAIDFVLLVVAVDDGPMPQTVEHVQILSHLGVSRGFVLLSKCDTANPQRIAQVRSAVSELLASTSLEKIPALAISSKTGAGMEELKALLAKRAIEHEAARESENARGRRARFTVDRVFTVRGAGTVATGTIYDGVICCEERLAVASSGAPMRVRGIQVHGREVNRAVVGERAAINLTGAELPKLARGDWLIDPQMVGAGRLVDVRLSLLPESAALRHATRARFHLGASDVACRVLMHGREQLEPGGTARARLQLDADCVAVNGDRFVLRDTSGSRTLGGGCVVDPCPLGRRKLLGDAEFEVVSDGEPRAALGAMLGSGGSAGVILARFERIFNLSRDALAVLLRDMNAVVLGKTKPIAMTSGDAAEIASRMVAALDEDQRHLVPISELHDACARDIAADAFDSLLRERSEALGLAISGGRVSLRGRRDAVRQADIVLWQRIQPLLSDAGTKAAEIEDLASAARVSVGRLRPVLHAHALAGDLFQLRPGKYLARAHVARLADLAAHTAARFEGGRFTAAQYRDSIGTGRMLAIQILEMLDAAGVTHRSGDVRTMARDPKVVFGQKGA